MPRGEAWISVKYLNENSFHDKLTTSVNATDGKIKINFSSDYQYLSHSNLSLVLKHVGSNLKVAFVAPTKVYKVHSKAVLSVDAAENALAVSSCEQDKLLVWDSRTGMTYLYKNLTYCYNVLYYCLSGARGWVRPKRHMRAGLSGLEEWCKITKDKVQSRI